MSERPVRAFQFIEGGARYGAAVSVMNIAEGMRQTNVEVEFGVFKNRPLGDALREHGFKVHEIEAERRFDIGAIRQLMKLFASERYDIVHTHLSRATVNGTFAARLARVPVVSTIHGMNRKYTYTLANHIMTVSEAAKRHLVSQGVPASRVTAVYNCLPLEPFADMPDSESAKASYGFSKRQVVLGTISRAHEQKGIDVAIGAIPVLRSRGIDAKYLFVGDGPHLGKFREQVAKLGIEEHVSFPGFSDDVASTLAAMDYFLFPTHKEAFGISLLEAMAARVPVIASDVGGVPEVIAEGSGILVHDGTPEAYANAVVSLLDKPQQREEIIRAARRRVETVFSPERTAASVEQVYRLTIRQAELAPKRRFREVSGPGADGM